MMVLQVRDLIKEYEGSPVLNGVTFHLAGGERVGLVGTNGCGKTTLMKILAGELPCESGSVRWVTDGLSRAYLSQEAPFDPGQTLGRQLKGIPDGLLARCGITREMLSRKPGALSGGQKTRAALARALHRSPDVLLLDEPTNHLDTDGLAWLESLLASYRGSVLVVSHDRYFLDRVTTRIIEMENGKVKEYPGNYSAYAEQKRMELERAQEEYRQYVVQKKHLEEAIRRQTAWAQANVNFKPPQDALPNWRPYQGAQAKAKMQIAKSMEKRLERIKVEKPREATAIRIRMDDAGGVAKNLILAENLGFTYDGERWILRDAGFYVQRGEKVAIIGPNGAGKSTLIRLILGELAPTEGTLYRSPLRVAYLAQEMEHLNPENTVLTEVTGGNRAMDQAYVRTLLGCLLFSREQVLKPVSVLSGGEKIRLTLAKILLAGPDMLVLDEPTNGLDLPSRERVEEALEGYPGTLLLVSHDRYLLRKLASKVLLVADGRVEPFGGGYEAFVGRGDVADGRRQADEERRLLLENRLAQLSAALVAPKPEEKERLDQEFIAVSRELRQLKERS
jgi:macrolide transport system ATP-binding/permease protein